MTEPSSPALIAIWRAGQERACARYRRRSSGRRSAWRTRLALRRRGARRRRRPADAFPTAALSRACVLDAILALLHLDSVAPPTRITATPPASFASRSAASRVVSRSGLLDLRLDLGRCALDVVLLARALTIVVFSFSIITSWHARHVTEPCRVDAKISLIA